MGVSQPHQVHHALNRAVLARRTVQRVEHKVRRCLGQFQRNIATHVDAGDAVAARFERIGNAIAAHQRNQAFG